MKVIIADDEIHICSLLKHLIEWDRLGLELAGVFNDGESLLEGFEEDPADILLCDIEMGDLNGLEAIRIIKEKHPSCQCIIISGFRNFDYAQTAIRYGVNNYLLKPIDQKDLNDTLQSVVNKLNESSSVNDVIVNYSTRAKLFNHLDKIGENTTIEEINRSYRYHFAYGCFVLMHTIFTKLDIKSAELSEISNTFTEELKRRLKEYSYDLECFDVSQNSITTIINFRNDDKKPVKTLFDGILRDVCIKMDAMYSCFTYFGISTREYDACHLSRQKDEATTVLVNRFASPDIRCFYAEDGEAAYVTAELSVNEENTLINQIQTVDSDAVIVMLRDFFRSKQEEIREKPQLMTTYYFLFVDKINDTVYDLAENKENKDNVRKRAITAYENCRTVNELERSLYDFTTELMDSCLSKKKSNLNIYVQQTQEYLTNHYAEKISLETVAYQLNISPTHLSTIFKKETGIGFNQYLINVRIEEAKKLLRSSKYNLNEVANAVGYNDAGYFSILFKKETKISPGEFRRLHQLKIGE
ncbi:MAG: response regulator [Erysipelotrichaceae bacterium]|nr:response regulator [Erysipelotrichaceae bacterium]